MDDQFLSTTLHHFKNPFPHTSSSLPSPTSQSHASTLLILPSSGAILCAWFGGSLEGNPDISIYLSRLARGASTWEPARKMTHDATRSEQNPLLFATPGGDVWLLYTSQRGKDQCTAMVKRLVSRDGGDEWSESDLFLGDPGTFIRQPVILCTDGRWVLPTFKCRVEQGQHWIGNDDVSAVQVSSDQGQTWSETIVPESFGCVHMGIQQVKSGSYLALYRSRWADHIYRSTSQDAQNWTPPQATSLPNNNSSICFAVLPSGRIVLIYNHASRLDALDGPKDLSDRKCGRPIQPPRSDGRNSFWGAPRAPLCAAWSDDEGLSWRRRILQDGDGFCMSNDSEKKLNRELSYPSVAVGKDGTVHVAFTLWRQSIKYIQLQDTFFSDGAE